MGQKHIHTHKKCMGVKKKKKGWGRIRTHDCEYYKRNTLPMYYRRRTKYWEINYI